MGESSGRGVHYGACAVCGNEYEARSATEAEELHDAFEDHVFVQGDDGPDPTL